jgi:Bacterial Ig-like domain (group 3)/FG-GAP-like repeat/FG-GAP repeat
MKTHKLAIAMIVAGLVLPVMGAVVTPMLLAPTYSIDRARLAAVASQQPAFTVEQHTAIAREIQSELHPLWKNLSWPDRAKRAAMLAARLLSAQGAAVTGQTLAAFVGNQTVINNPLGGVIALQRQSNCTLSLYEGPYTLGTSPSLQLSAPTPDYETTLHKLAGLTTQADVFAKGCVDPSVGIGSRRGAYLGKTSQGLGLFAVKGYDSLKGSNALFSAAVNPNSTAVQNTYSTDLSMPEIASMASGDLNGDGRADVVGLDGTAGSIGVWLANSNGTLGTPTFYSLPGTTTEAAVIADVNGDGKMDVVVATRGSTGAEEISVLTGNGNGTLNAPQSFAVTTPGNDDLNTLIAADFRGTGYPDIVGSNGLVLLNSGTGTFAQGKDAFAATASASAFGPNLAAGDFNNDGKLDIAFDNGSQIQTYLGNGDGTFVIGKAYASISDVGYLTATDLDGDGNVDIYVGLANGGVFGTDNYEVNEAYALMGNGNGTFQGAPFEPFVYTGFNVAALTGKTILGAVGVNANGTLTTYLGNGMGNFNATSTFSLSTTYQGQAVAPGGDGSFALGDVNGDGIPDLVYNSGYTISGNPGPGVLIALGNGQGGFGAPTFYALPSTLAAGDIDISWTISDVRVADLNRDGKADLVYSYTDTSSQKNITYSGTVVQLSNGNGTFQAPLVIPYQSAAYSSSGSTQSTSVQVITDLNNDGIPDLLSLGNTSTHNIYTSGALIQVALGKGDGTFGTPTTVATIQIEPVSGFGPTLVTGDVNGDGIPDILALTADASDNTQLEVWLGNGDGTYKAPNITSYAAQYLNTGQTLAVADFNGDGKLDVAIFDPYTPSDNGISFGNGNGTFQTITATNAALPGAQPVQTILVNAFGTAIASDFNGDGKPDLLVGTTLLLSQSSSSGSGTAPTTTTVTAAPNPAAVGQSVTLTAKVTSTATGTLTGTVEFLDGTTVLGSPALTAAGTVTLTSTTLAAGAHSLTAHYSGNTTFAASTSSAVSLTVNAATPTFAVSASPALGSVAPGSSVTTTLTLTPSGGFSGTVALACSGLPTGATCSFSSASVAVSGTAAASTLTIATTAATAQLRAPSSPFDPFLPTGNVLAVILTPFIARRCPRRASRPRALAWLGLLLMGAGVLYGCNGGNSSGAPPPPVTTATPAGTYPITITATSGSTSHTVSYALTVT